MKGLAIAILFVLIAAPVGFLVWLNLNYWTGLTGHGNGWQVACSVLDVIAFVGVGAVALFGFGALVTWLVDTICT